MIKTFCLRSFPKGISFGFRTMSMLTSRKISTLNRQPIVVSKILPMRRGLFGGAGLFSSTTNWNPIPFSWEYNLESSILWPSNIVERFLEIIHWHTGLPWYGTLLVYTVAVRSLLLPLFVKQSRSSALSIQYRPQVQALQQQARTAQQQGRAEEAQKKMYEAMTFMKAKGISPFRVLGMSLAPIPIFMASFFAIRNMTRAPLESMLDQGCLWFTNLAAPDPLFILPIVSAICLFGSIELARRTSPTPGSKTMTWVMRGLAVASVPVTSYMPSALVVYFATSNLISCIIQGVMNIPGTRKLLNIPVIPKQHHIAQPSSTPSFFSLLKQMPAASNTNEQYNIPKKTYINKPKVY